MTGFRGASANGGDFDRMDRGPGSIVSGSGGGEAVEEDEPLHVVDDVGHADLHRRAGDADGADEEVHLVLLHGEDMLDARSGPWT